MSNSSPGTEEQLRDALEAFAEGVRPTPGAYRVAHGDWQRRERRRRLVLAVLIAVVFTLATLIGLWVLNQAPSRPGVIFDDGVSTGNAQPADRTDPPHWNCGCV
ncbi:hypothetical protein AA958_11930 [Streptomyces sp. CNQ-509]|uniref:hypothetical protein n=1 Tax=unclassified Streptomyces TaxID=2593676 RepID=UPI00062DF937|nr:hypothetical protein [Streptomyces sp. CNQ-509]AKH82824.1 hypothetical protein AA958_11930 [Streptomyces sp. CNQ-509]